MEVTLHPRAELNVADILADWQLERFDQVHDVWTQTTYVIAEVTEFTYVVQVIHRDTVSTATFARSLGELPMEHAT